MVSVVHLMCYPHFSDLEPSTRCTSSIELQNRLITELALSITYPYHAYEFSCFFFFFFQAEDGIRDIGVTGVQTCALPILEEQTKKLFHVCSLRGIPVFTFVNKMDREARDPFELMDEIENVLGIKSYPMNWPIGSGKDFKGIYNRKDKVVGLFNGEKTHGQKMVESMEGGVDDPAFKEILGEELHDKLVEDIELLDIAGDNFDIEKVSSGDLTPVFFGSALTNFGVESFLKAFLDLTTPPLGRNSDKIGRASCRERV